MWGDRVLAIISLSGLIAFMSIVLWYVAEPDLIIIVCLVLAMAAYDFWRMVGPRRAADKRSQ